MQFLNLFLQITTAPVDSTGSPSSADSVSMFDLIIKGGVMMIPIVILSVLAVYLIVERFMTLKKSERDPEDFMEQLREYIVQGDLSRAKNLCKEYNTPFSRMLEKGVAKLGKPLANIEASIENMGKIEVYKLERNLNALATIAGAAPMLGFLGTVTGMVQAFMSIAQVEGSVSPKLLSGGIYEAMLTTVAGLIVGIIAYVGYNYLTGKVEKIVHQMEYSSIEFIELLQEPR
jgi:biopolymer transport protein ExbB